MLSDEYFLVPVLAFGIDRGMSLDSASSRILVGSFWDTAMLDQILSWACQRWRDPYEAVDRNTRVF